MKITIPKHQRTIFLTPTCQVYYRLPTDKLFVEFPKLEINIQKMKIQDKIFQKIADAKNKIPLQFLVQKPIPLKVINLKNIWANLYSHGSINDTCLGENYYQESNVEKQMIEKFFNSKFRKHEIEIYEYPTTPR